MNIVVAVAIAGAGGDGVEKASQNRAQETVSIVIVVVIATRPSRGAFVALHGRAGALERAGAKMIGDGHE